MKCVSICFPVSGVSGPGGAAAGEYGRMARRDRFHDLPTVHVALKISDFPVKGWRWTIHDPASHSDNAAVFLGPDRKIDNGAVTETVGMDIAEMRKVEEIVNNQLIVAVNVEKRSRIECPVRMTAPPPVGYQAGIGKCLFSRPEPKETVALDDWPGRNRRVGRNSGLAGYGDTGTGCVEFQSVITATYSVTGYLAARQGKLPVTATVFKCCGRSVRQAKQDHGPVQQRTAQRLALAKFVGVGSNIPAILKIHVGIINLILVKCCKTVTGALVSSPADSSCHFPVRG